MPRLNYLSVKTIVILGVCVFSSEGSQKKDSPVGQNELVKVEIPESSNSSVSLRPEEKSQFPAIITNLSSNITLNLQSADEQETSASTSKVVRHLGNSGKNLRMDKLVLGMLKMNNRRPLLRSRIMGGGGGKSSAGGVRIFKAVQSLPPGGDVARYAPRSLDMGLGNLMNYNPLENFYGPQQQPSLLPTSSSPNSLDHLYLPEVSVKDYMKPLDMNGLGNFGNNPGANEISANAIPYAEGFNYNERIKLPVGPRGFRGNPPDGNYHGNPGQGMHMGPPGHHHGGGGGPPEHFNEPLRGPPPPGGDFTASHEKVRPHHHQRHSPHGDGPEGPPPPPSRPEHSRGSSSNKFPHRDEREDGEGPPHYQESPPRDLPPPPPIGGNPGASALQGDEGLWNILGLAQLLQSQGLSQQLSSVNSLAGVGGESEGEDEGSSPHHFDAPSPGGPTNRPPGGDGPRGGKFQESSGENDFGNYDGPPDHPHSHGDGPNRHEGYNNPHNKGGKYGKPGRPYNHFNGDEGGPGGDGPGGPGGPDSNHYNDFNEGPRPGGGGSSGRGKPGQYNNYESPGGYGDGPGHSPDGGRGGIHGQPPPNPYKGDNDFNNPNGSERYENNRGPHGPGSSGNPNQHDEHVPNLDGNPGNDSPGPYGSPNPDGGDYGGGEGGENPGEGGPHEGYNTRDGPYDGYNSNSEYGGGYGQAHPTNKPNSSHSSTKPPHQGGGDGPVGGFDEDGEYNSNEQFDGPPRNPHHSPGGNDSGRDGEYPSDDHYYNGYD